MNLLIDIGNSRFKWAVAEGLNLTIHEPIINRSVNRQTLKATWQTLSIIPKRLGLACVGPSQLAILAVEVARELWPTIAIHRAQSMPRQLGVSNGYRQPEKLGVDRWLSMIAAFQTYRSALCLAGCGTAVTIDMIDASGKHLGGLICPGIRLMQHALAVGTENLDQAQHRYPFSIADFTDAAIYNGALAAACGAIEHAIRNENVPLKVVLTGGDADLIAGQLEMPATVESDLVLKGLALSMHNLC